MRLRYGETVTVKRRDQNAHGEQVVVSEHPVEQFAIFIRSSSEPLDLRSDVVTTATGLGPYGADIRSEDLVVQADGRQWEVVGIPSNIKSPVTGLEANLKCTLQHVSG